MQTQLTPAAAAIATFVPSVQQQTFFDWIVDGVGSCILEAVAGAGKTTTLIHGLTLMKIPGAGKVFRFFGAFSKDIVMDIRDKVAKVGIDHCTVNTMHAEGFGALRRAFKNVRVDENKCRDIYRAASEKYPEYKPYEGAVLQLVSLAKQNGVGLSRDIKDRNVWIEIVEHHDIETFDEKLGEDKRDMIIVLARKVLERSNATSHEVVDFDDMIYAPLWHKVKFFQYHWVLVDEAQDTNEARRLLALAILRPGGRLVAVGDSKQAIFGFTGADANSLQLIGDATNAKYLPLTTTYRCPKAVVKYAQQWVSHIQAAETAPEGKVEYASIERLAEIAKPGDAILCRFNAPLVKHVYQFIAAGIPALIEGRDIAEGLLTLARRWKTIGSYSKFLERLDDYVARETKKFREKEEESRAVAIEDKVGCLRVIIQRAQKIDPNAKDIVARVCQEIEAIFAKKDGATIDKTKVVLFSSGHKSKGREWKRVVWLTTGPSPWARQVWEIDQEDHLCYVMATRSKDELILVDITEKKAA